MPPTELATAVEHASRRPEVTTAITELYVQIQSAVAARKPRCDLSGRCCHFDEFGHRLYVTTMELAAFLSQHRLAPLAPKPNPAGCPFQHARLCTAHNIRPMGCRMFYCDPSAQDWQNEHYEQFHNQLKRLHETLDVPYAYVEWRTALAALNLNANTQESK